MTLAGEVIGQKRPRSEDGDLECAPIAKKFNGLNINKSDSGRRQEVEEVNNRGSTPGASHHHHHHQNGGELRHDPPTANSSSSNTDQQVQQHYPHQQQSPNGEVEIQYQPSLNESQNPLYYSINQTLFQAHHERCQRLGIASNPPDE